MTKYKDYVLLFSLAEGSHVKRLCTVCQKFVPGARLTLHVEKEHREAEASGLIIQVNDTWWRKRGY